MTRIVLILALCSVVATVFSNPASGEDMKDPKNPVVVMKTSMGDMEIELYKKEAPGTVQNFLWYVDNGFYDGLVFHRVIDGFMIQGGGYSPAMKKQETNPPIENEANNGLSNEKYTIAMARTNAVHSATAQFFINNQDNPNLDYYGPSRYGYCVFGKVIAGQDVVDEISKVETGNKNGMKNVPVEPVVIEKVYREDGKKKTKKTKKSD
jgi:cyclophilin family peptidyl-prolyl cis-trans isomerase